MLEKPAAYSPVRMYHIHEPTCRRVTYSNAASRFAFLKHVTTFLVI